MTLTNKGLHIIPFFILLIISGCTVKYSFTGASISPDVKTVSIDYFQNQAQIVQPTLSQTFTEELKNTFITQTNLEMTEGNGDLQFSGAITGYNTRPMAIQGDEVAALNRLTVTVKVKFINIKDEKQNFDKTFSAFADYDSNENLESVEEQLIAEIVQQLTEDIFNAAVANW
ncbi:MAG: hypothetical protein C0594_15035 [Marinilabiliales bacterium]|nr:MAG: hypothetical protein C0594_15035 [Marinilabiliales bacterium]